ncbi:MAG: hypothetical protein K2G89_06725 [Lachnospiraceae bacterium]|nr:hypothetical protein [Lachnospiraceae bacterium]
MKKKFFKSNALIMLIVITLTLGMNVYAAGEKSTCTLWAGDSNASTTLNCKAAKVSITCFSYAKSDMTWKFYCNNQKVSSGTLAPGESDGINWFHSETVPYKVKLGKSNLLKTTTGKATITSQD